MKKHIQFIASTLGVALFVVCISLSNVWATDTSRYVISAKAGGVNLVVGSVTVERKKDGTQTALTTKDQLEAGDLVTTGSNGRVEITLNPGSYLRLGENTSLELTTTSFDDLRLKLIRGSAIIEAVGSDGLSIPIEVSTPQTKVVLSKKGVYRLNVNADGSTELKVLKGQAEVGSGAALKVKGGQQTVVGVSVAGIAKFDKKKDQDVLDQWSKSRAETLAESRRQLERKAVNFAMTSFYRNYSFGGFRLPFYGGWCYDYRLGHYYFIPFDPWAWESPYGFGYFDASFGFSFFSLFPHSYCPYRCGGGYNSPNPIITGGGVSNGSGSGSGSGNGAPTTKIRDVPNEPPPTISPPTRETNPTTKGKPDQN